MNAMPKPSTSLLDGLYRVETKFFTAGFIIDHGRVISCAPILRKRLDYWLQHAEKIDG